MTLSPSFKFAFGSPGKRVYLVNVVPCRTLCDTSSENACGAIRVIGNRQPFSPPVDPGWSPRAAGASATRVAVDVGACQFTYTAGTAQRNALGDLDHAADAQQRIGTIAAGSSIGEFTP